MFKLGLKKLPATEAYAEIIKNAKISKNIFFKRKLTISPKTSILKSALIALCAVTLLLSSSCQGIQNPIVKASEAVKAQNYDKAASYARMALITSERKKARIILNYVKYGDNLLHGAFWEKDTAALKYLATIVHDINAEDPRFGAPVLVLAAAWGDIQAVKILIEAGADPNYGTDKDGHSALMWAAKNFDEQLEMTEVLLEAGAQVNIASNYGETPLSIAEEYGNLNIAKLLREYGATE